MNINLKFENVTWQKKIGGLFIGIACAIFLAIIIIVISVLSTHYSSQVTGASEQANLVSLGITEEVESVTDSLKFISNLISDDEMRSNISSSQLTSLLNELISKDEKVFGAFVMLDKSEYEDIEDITDQMSFVSSDKEASEAIDLLEANDDLEGEEIKPVVSKKDNILSSVNKFVYKSKGSTFETNLDRLNTLEYKKSYMKVMLTKEPQMMSPVTNTYDGVEVTTCTYTVPIIINGNFEGIIGIDIDIDKLKDELAKKAENISSEFMITDKAGNIIGASNKIINGSRIQDVYNGSNNKKTLEYIETNLESGIPSSFNAGTSDFLHDKVLIMMPTLIEDSHVWNIVFISKIDKIITNSVATILLVSLINLVLFALLILFVWISFGEILNKKYESLFKRVDGELEKIKANSKRIMEDIEDIEEISIEEYTAEEAELKEAEETKKEETAPIEEVKEEIPTEEVKAEEAPSEESSESAPSEIKEETPAEENVEDNGFDAEAFAKARAETDAKLQAAEDEKAAEETKENSEHEAEKIDLDNPTENPDGSKVSAMEQLATANANTEGLDEILQNKDGNVDNDDFMADAEAKLAAKMAADNSTPTENKEETTTETAAPEVEEPKIEEPKIEEPKIEEPKIEEPKIEEPKIEEPKKEKVIAVDEDNLNKPIANAAPPKKEKDYYSVKLEPEDDFVPREHKLTNKEMDDLLHELEAKRKAEAEAQGIELEEINVEEMSLSDLLGGRTSDDM